jgi:hypothetical protein
MPVSIGFNSGALPPLELQTVVQGTLGPAGGALMDVRFRGPTHVSYRIPARRIEIHQVTRFADGPSGSSLAEIRIADGMAHDDILAGLRLINNAARNRAARTPLLDTYQALTLFETLEDYIRICRIETTE